MSKVWQNGAQNDAWPTQKKTGAQNQEEIK